MLGFSVQLFFYLFVVIFVDGFANSCVFSSSLSDTFDRLESLSFSRLKWVK